jgi:hypothetical protein
MANDEHVALLKKGAEVWNEWRSENPDMRPDLREANLSKVDIREADLVAADYSRAKRADRAANKQYHRQAERGD